MSETEPAIASGPKRRTRITEALSAEVLFQQDHTCCVCREPGLRVQIHHINEDPADNRIENFALLCFEDHDRTQQRGGFGKHLLRQEVVTYRNDWVKRVAQRRDDADKLAATRMSAASPKASLRRQSSSGRPWEPQPNGFFAKWLPELILLKAEIFGDARIKWDSGTSQVMNQGCYDVIDVLQNIWESLADYYPPEHFSDVLSAREYINEYVSERILWYRAINSPEGEGTSGSIIGQIQAGSAMDDLSMRIAETVRALVVWRGVDEIDIDTWEKDWNAIT